MTSFSRKSLVCLLRELNNASARQTTTSYEKVKYLKLVFATTSPMYINAPFSQGHRLLNKGYISDELE